MLRVRDWGKVGLLDLAGVASRLAHICAGEGQNECSPRRAALFAALCLALFACAQSPTPAPLTPNVAIATPAAQPTPAPPPPSAALTPIAAQSTPYPAPAPPTIAVPTSAPAPPTVTPQPTTSPLPPASPPVNIAFTQITVGRGHACGLRENSAAVCWGNQNSALLGALDAPSETAFTQISAGFHFTCGLRQDAAIVCWGDNTYGQAAPPQGAFTEIAAGRDHVCAIPISQGSQDARPKLLCWGNPFPNGAEPLPLDAPISDIQSGHGFTCGLTPQADIACLSINRIINLPTKRGTITHLTEITSVPFTQLAIGIAHLCALRQDGSVFCQGANYSWQATPPPTKFVQIAAGWYHSCGITQARAIECWGSGRAGAPGERLLAPDGEFAAIAIGWRDSCALRASGRAVCWRAPRDLPLAPSTPPDNVSLAFGGAKFNDPVDIFPWPSSGLAIVDRRGVIAVHRDRRDPPPSQTILDLTDAVVCCEGESGMFSAALDPQFDDFPFLYVWYRTIADSASGDSAPRFVGRLARFRVNNGAAVKRSELAVLEVDQPQRLHLGGAVRFGADGMLYLGIGDNGTAADAQALDKLRGKIIRIDVRGANAERRYRIPPDNPFVGAPGARPEIWAYGLRNPWRMAFDPKEPGSLFIADVGNLAWEEVSIATAGSNLGWPLCEANACAPGVDTAGLAPPAVAYGRVHGCAIIGGVTVSWLDGGFIFSDLCGRRVWLLEPNISPDSAQASPQWRMREIADLSALARNIIAFGAGEDGSVYALSRNGPILRLHPDLVE